MNKYLNIIKKKMEKINTKKHEHFLFVTLIVVIILWIILYIIPETFASLFSTILGKIILLLIVVLVSFKNIMYGVVVAIIIISFYRYSHFMKEGFVWSSKNLLNFLELENTINRGIVFDTNIAQQQASEKEVEYFIKYQKWPWNKEVEKLYKEAVRKNPFIRTSESDSLNYARSIYNQNAILQILALQTNEGNLLVNGVEKYVPNNQVEPPYAYNSGLISKYNSIIKCNMNNPDNAIMEQKTMPPLGSLNSPTITQLDYNDLENKIPGFKFIKQPCNPCQALNVNPSYNCPFSLKTKNNPTGRISDLWKYLWNLKF
jgi:hypothetical protein